MTRLKQLADKYHLYIIEDAAEALGSTYMDKHTGTIGDIGIFSFNGNKIVTAGSGGMLVTWNKEYADTSRGLINQGRSFHYIDRDIYNMRGYNYRMSNLQAALGLAQFKRLPEFLKIKRRNAETYKKNLVNEHFAWQKELPEALSNWWFFSIIGKLFTNYCWLRSIFKPINLQPIYKEACSCPNAEYLCSKGYNLPSSTLLREDDIVDICNQIKKNR
jgi:perosamine synthetase